MREVSTEYFPEARNCELLLIITDYFLINIRKFRERAAGHICKAWFLTVNFNIML
jgi:hypothetical protein